MTAARRGSRARVGSVLGPQATPSYPALRAVGYVAHDVNNNGTNNIAIAAIDENTNQVAVNVDTNNGSGIRFVGWSDLPAVSGGFEGVGIAQMNNTLFVVATKAADSTLWFIQNTLTSSGYSAAGWAHTWTQVSTTPIYSVGPAVVANPNNGGTLIIAAELYDNHHHIIKGTPSSGGGLNFSAWSSNSPLGTLSGFYGDGPGLSITPDGHLNFFASWDQPSSFQGIVLNVTSTDNGATWTGLTGLTPGDVRDTPAASSPDDSHMYVIGIGNDFLTPFLDPILGP
jgi:hypothetical protein